MSDVEEKSGAEGGGLVRRRRRRWSEAQKRQIVAETHEHGVSVPMVAQRYNVNANQVFAWQRLFREPACDTGIDGFVPVVVGAPAPGNAAWSCQTSKFRARYRTATTARHQPAPRSGFPEKGAFEATRRPTF